MGRGNALKMGRFSVNYSSNLANFIRISSFFARLFHDSLRKITFGFKAKNTHA
ncbi:Uncharacterised protein [Vibrio furnissii]|nr:Uncharacterised protein [Vibrio furnissii]